MSYEYKKRGNKISLEIHVDRPYRKGPRVNVFTRLKKASGKPTSNQSVGNRLYLERLFVFFLPLFLPRNNRHLGKPIFFFFF